MRRRPRPVALELPGLPAPVFKPGVRLRKSASKRRPSPAPLPWECVVLGVDTARRSGWSVFSRGHLVARGELDTLEAGAIEGVVQQAVDGAAALGLPLVLVLEKPWGGKNVGVVTALGAAIERWERVWRALAQGHLGRVVKVGVSTWRAAVLGPEWLGVERELVRAHEQLVARALLGVDQVGGDEAPAVLIGYWAARAGEVGRRLSKTAQRASLAAWGGGA